MKAKKIKSTFVFSPAMLERQVKIVYCSLAYREMISQLSSTLEMSVDDLSCMLAGFAVDIARDSSGFYELLETDKRLMLEAIKREKEKFENEYC